MFDITLVYNYEYYGDVVFQVALARNEIIAAGGCYDSLIEYFMVPGQRQRRPSATPVLARVRILLRHEEFSIFQF